MDDIERLKKKIHKLYMRQWRLKKQLDPEWLARETIRKKNHYINNKAKYIESSKRWQNRHPIKLRRIKRAYYLRKKNETSK